MPDEVMQQRVYCPNCGVGVTLRYLRYGHACIPRGRPKKSLDERERDVWCVAMAALTRRLIAREEALNNNDVGE